MFDIIFPPLHREGYRMLAIAVIITMLLILINKILGIIGFVLTIWVGYFCLNGSAWNFVDIKHMYVSMAGTRWHIPNICRSSVVELGDCPRKGVSFIFQSLRSGVTRCFDSCPAASTITLPGGAYPDWFGPRRCDPLVLLLKREVFHVNKNPTHHIHSKLGL